MHEISFNSYWILMEKGLRLILNIYILGKVAGYLGVEGFGIYSYCLTIFLLFEPLATLGLKDIIKREIVLNPDETNKILGTGISLRLLSAVILFVSTVLIGFFINREFGLLVSIFMLTYFSRSFEIIEGWFEINLKSKILTYLKSFAFIAASAMKLYGVYYGKKIDFFVIAYLLEFIIIATLTKASYKAFSNSKPILNLNRERIRYLISESWPLIFSSIAISIYMKIDQVMLKSMINVQEVGYYAPAVRISEIWNFIPLSLAASFFAKIVTDRDQLSREDYHAKLQLIFCFMTWMALPIMVTIYLFSPHIIQYVFGLEYNNTIGVMQIHIWSCIFVFWGCAQSPWNIAENKTRHFLFRTVSGAVSNIVLNIYFIPRYGAFGAAWATLISYLLSNWLLNIFGKENREIFFMQAKSFNPAPIFRYLKN